MQLKEKNRNDIIEHKKRIENHKKVIERDVEDRNQEKTAKENGAIKKKIIKKKIVDKKALKEKQKAISEKIMDDARNISIEKNSPEEEHEEPKVVITKEERAERFKRLHAMVQDMMKKQNM